MKKFDLYRYFQKGKYWIILLSVLAGLAFFLLASNRQTYTARTVIEYDYEIAAAGKTPNGKQLDVTEIKSSKVIQPVIDALGLTDSVDKIRSSLSIQGYVSEDEETLKAALLKEGMEYTNTPTVYVVRYTVGSNRSGAYAQDVLDALIRSYISYFGEKYVSESTIPNNASIISNDTYDYLDMADMLDEHISDVLSYMQHKASDFLSFRPICADCSFQDIYDTYKFIQDSELPDLYVDILTNELSKDMDLLLSDYGQRIDTIKVDQEYFRSAAEQMSEIMEIFAEKSKLVDGAANAAAGGENNQGDSKSSYAFILSDVYANYDTAGTQTVDRTTTYDYLIDRYARFLINQSDLEIDEAHYQSIKELYTTPAASMPAVERLALEQSVNVKFRRISAELDSLYQRLYDGVREYNDVRGSDNLRMRTSVAVSEGMNIKLYAVLVVVVFFILVSAVVILIGRLGDFIEYTVWTDHITNLPNRSRCDQYIEELAKLILPEHFTCLVMKVMNINAINEKFGREFGNQVLMQVGEIIRQTAANDASVFYNNNLTYISFINPCDETRAEHLTQRIAKQMDSFKAQRDELVVEFHIGFAESSSSNVFQIHKLLSTAFRKI